MSIKTIQPVTPDPYLIVERPRIPSNQVLTSLSNQVGTGVDATVTVRATKDGVSFQSTGPIKFSVEEWQEIRGWIDEQVP